MHGLSARLGLGILIAATVVACSKPHGTSGTSSSSGGTGGSGATATTSSTGTAGGGGTGGSAGTGGATGTGGTTVVPGNGCPAALGVDAGFYTCSRQFFVSPTGIDSNGGTSLADALATLGAATKLALKGGDCVTVEAGVYHETVNVSTSGSADTCTGYVVFRAASQGAARIVSTDPYQAVTVGASYVMMDGFDLQDTATGGAFTAGSNTVLGGHVVVYHHIAAIRNVAHDSGGAGLAAIHADYIRFEGNTVYKNSATSTYGDSGIDLWEAQASDAAPGFHIVIRNNVSYQNAEWNIASPTDGEGIILDSFDYADSTYGTTPYHQQSLIENNVIWGNGGRGIEVGGVGPTSYVTIRNNTIFDDNRQQLPWPGAEIASLGNHNEIYNNVAILGPDDKDGPGGTELTVVLQDSCGVQGGVMVTTGSVWQNNIAFSMLTGNRDSYSSCPAQVSATANKLGINPMLTAASMAATSAASFGIDASSPAAHAGTGTSYAAYDFNYKKRPNPPSIGAFEP
jgi:serralysin